MVPSLGEGAVVKRTADELALAVLNALNIEATNVYEFTIHAEAGRPLRVGLVKWVLEADDGGMDRLSKVSVHYELKEVAP